MKGSAIPHGQAKLEKSVRVPEPLPKLSAPPNTFDRIGERPDVRDSAGPFVQIVLGAIGNREFAGDVDMLIMSHIDEEKIDTRWCQN